MVLNWSPVPWLVILLCDCNAVENWVRLPHVIFWETLEVFFHVLSGNMKNSLPGPNPEALSISTLNLVGWNVHTCARRSGCLGKMSKAINQQRTHIQPVGLKLKALKGSNLCCHHLAFRFISENTCIFSSFGSDFISLLWSYRDANKEITHVCVIQITTRSFSSFSQKHYFLSGIIFSPEKGHGNF